MTDDWQDISTAPKDGTRFLGWIPHREECVIVFRHDPGGKARNPRHNYECWVVEYQGYMEKPTHWMPLPQPPKDKP